MVKFANFQKNAFCKVRFSNLAKDFKSETKKPLINVHQWRYLYPKLFVLKLFVNFSPFFIFLTTPNGHVQPPGATAAYAWQQRRPTSFI